ncbi:MAG: PAS domain-containing sensor histidine kinase [Magnetococcales bacterium]|nr:PAS domain-containing sensor histidine kinase [Magnetococcales bacterium]
MYKSLSLKSKLIALVILPLLLIGITSIISLHYLEGSNFETILSDKHNYYKKTLTSLITTKGDFLSFNSSLILQNKKLHRSLNSGNIEQISKNSIYILKKISPDNHLLFIWRDGQIIYSLGAKETQVAKYSTPLLTKVAKFKHTDFAVEKLPDGTLGLIHATAYNSGESKQPYLVVQGIYLDGIFTELQKIIGTTIISIKQLDSVYTDDYHLSSKNKSVIFYLPLIDTTEKTVAAIAIEEDISNQLNSFQHTRKATFFAFALALLTACFLVYKILKWTTHRTNFILDMLHLVSSGTPLPPSNIIENPDVLERIENGIREQSQTIQTSQDKLIKAKETAEKEVLERKLAEETILKISNQNKMLLNCAGEGIYGLDKKGLCTFINPAACKMIDRNQNEVLGKSQHDLIHHTKADGSPYHLEDCHIFAVLNDGESRHVNDEIFWRKDGTSFPVEYLSTPIIEKDKIVGAVVVFSDITDRTLSQRRTKRLFAFQEVLNIIHQISFKDIPIEKQLDSALTAIMTIPWLFVQHKGAIFLTNDTNEKELKMVTQQGLNKALINSCATVPFDYCICGRAAQSKVIIHAENIDERHEITFAGIQPHGHYAVPILLGQKLLGVLTLYLNEGHKQNSEETNLLLSIGNSIANMIERKKSEENLKNINQELEKRVNQRTLELQDYVKNLKLAQEQLIQSERMAALGGLVAGVAHEIKTPVGTSYTSSSYLQTQTDNFKEKFTKGGLTVSDLKAYLEEVDISTKLTITNLERAGKLLKNFKEIAVDQTSQEKRRFNLKEYIEEIVFTLSPRLKSSKHVVQVDCPDNISLDSYPGALSQILTNLIINSLIYGFEGIESGRIVISGSVDSKNVSIFYSDNGVGMKKTIVKQIYEPFFTTKRNFGGSGLGMNIVFNLVTQRLNGTISCESAPQKGTSFNIQFPIQT